MKKLFFMIFLSSILLLASCTTGKAIQIGDDVYFGEEMQLDFAQEECRDLLEMSRLPQAQEDEAFRQDIVRQATDRRCCLAEFEELAFLDQDPTLFEEFSVTCSGQEQRLEELPVQDTDLVQIDQKDNFIDSGLYIADPNQPTLANSLAIEDIRHVSCSLPTTTIKVGEVFLLDGKYRLAYEEGDAKQDTVLIADAKTPDTQTYYAFDSGYGDRRFALDLDDFPSSSHVGEYYFKSVSDPKKNNWDLQLICGFTCTDSDATAKNPNGYNPSKKGIVKGIYGTAADSCSPDGTGVIENFCSADGITATAHAYVTCPTGTSCVDGACVKKVN